MIGGLLMLLAAIALLAIASGIESGLYSLERVRLRIAADEGDRRAARLLRCCVNPTRTLAVLLLLQNVFHSVVASLNSSVLFPSVHGVAAEAAMAAALTPVLLVLGELLPKELFLRAPHRLMRSFEPALRMAVLVVGPLLGPVVALVRRERAEDGRRADLFDRAGVRAMLTLGDESHTLTPGQRQLADRVLRLRHVSAGHCMVPIERVDLVGPGAGVAEVLACGAATRHSRFPVRAPEGGRLLGYVTVGAAARAASPGAYRATDHLHPLPAIESDNTIAVALYRLQKAGKPMGEVVAGRERRTVGIITVADIIDLLFDEAAKRRGSRGTGPVATRPRTEG